MRAFANALCIGAMSLTTAWVTVPDAQAQGGRTTGQDDRATETRFSSPPSTSAQALNHAARRSAQPVTLDLMDVPLKEVLAEIERQSGVSLVFSWRVVPLEQRVSIKVKDVSAEKALRETLRGTDIEVRATAGGEIVLAKRPKRSALSEQRPVQEGVISGRVTDVRTGEGVMGASVTVEGTSLATTTREDGGFRVTGVPPGTYTVTARRLGYARGSQQVTVAADEEVATNFALEASAGILDQVVVTGTVVPTEIKALPTPVSVISQRDIALQRPRIAQDVFRVAVPTGVSWNLPSAPTSTFFSVRGASTLSGGGQMKVFLDGIEASAFRTAPIDPNAIERIEVIRGPQAAAIYGSDAIGGVIQIFTKRGNASLTRPQVEAEAELGVIQTPYDGFGGVLRQNYTSSVRGGTSDITYNFGAGFARTADFIPDGEISRQSSPSIYGGMRFSRGVIAADVSGRYYINNTPVIVNPLLSQTGFSFFSKPNYQPTEISNQTIGARIALTPALSWRNVLTVGVDRLTLNRAQTQPRLTTPRDTLLSLFNNEQTKRSIGFNTSIETTLSSDVTGSLTAGIDHYTLPVTVFLTSSALNTTGTIRTPPGQSVSASRSTTTNTGYFAQAQLGFRDAFFLTAGLRAEQNSGFGDDLGTPVSPRVGFSYAREVGLSTLKFRGSWGRAIRAPSPGQKFAAISPLQITLANPLLRPERQQGWDAGMDLAFGGRGSLSVTWYDQTAEDLILFVQLPSDSVPTAQFQNVGRVKNSGAEVEAAVVIGGVQLKGQYGYVRSRIVDLGPNNRSDLRIGDQPLLTPKHTAGAFATIIPRAGTTIAAGATYVGSWRQQDNLARFACLGGTGPCRATNRDYIVQYPDFVKLSASLFQTISRQLSGFVSVDNLSNNEAYEFSNVNPVIGRTTTIGLQFRY